MESSQAYILNGQITICSLGVSLPTEFYFCLHSKDLKYLLIMIQIAIFASDNILLESK